MGWSFNRWITTGIATLLDGSDMSSKRRMSLAICHIAYEGHSKREATVEK